MLLSTIHMKKRGERYIQPLQNGPTNSIDTNLLWTIAVFCYGTQLCQKQRLIEEERAGTVNMSQTKEQ